MCDVPFPESTSEEVKDFIDKQKAKFKAECDAGQGASCYEYARLQVSADKNVKAAMETLTRGCSELDNSASCGSLAALFRFGEGVEKDEARALTMYSKACSLGNRASCHVEALAELAGQGLPRNVPRAVTTLARLCSEHDISESCFMLAHHMLTREEQRDPVAAKPLLERACENGHPGACQHLAAMHRNGDGVARDREQFLKYAERAFTLQQDAEAHTLYVFREQRKTHPELYADGPGQPEPRATATGVAGESGV